MRFKVFSMFAALLLLAACETPTEETTASTATAAETPPAPATTTTAAPQPGFQPLGHLPTRHDARWHVAMAHGFFYEDFETPERSSPILAAEIRRSGWDYIAMGHKHVLADHSQGAAAAWYPGTPLPDWSAAPRRTWSVSARRCAPRASTSTSPSSSP